MKFLDFVFLLLNFYSKVNWYMQVAISQQRFGDSMLLLMWIVTDYCSPTGGHTEL